MADSMAAKSLVRHPVLPDIGKAKQAKATVRVPDIESDATCMPLIGAAIQRAVFKVGWTNKEAAAKVGVDDAEFGKWLSGGRRPHFDRLMAVDALRWPLICALADMFETAEEIVTLRRRA